ncbi:MAG: hypothetical protein FWD33_03830 [Alphaproteobacteria bacterium]|nr:hypothetical protein [Alphaproteobacteria bacterium]
MAGQEYILRISNLLEQNEASMAQIAANNTQIKALLEKLNGAPITASSGISLVEYVEFNFDSGKFNIDVYFGREVYKDIKVIYGAKKVFDDNTGYEIAAIRSICTKQRMSFSDATFDVAPKADKDGLINACQIVVRKKDKTGLFESRWVFRDFFEQPVFLGYGLHSCATDLNKKSSFTKFLINSLEYVRS